MQVRAILAQALGCEVDDPTDLVSRAHLDEALERLEPPKRREAGADYARLWARTFRPLVRHLRGRPEHALHLFTREVYPYLRGEDLAARVDEESPGNATVVLADLDPDYLEGMLEAFVAVSRARVTARHLGGRRFHVTYHVAGMDRLSRFSVQVEMLRIPVLVAAGVAAILGIAAAAPTGWTWLRAALILLAVLAIQNGATSWHDLRNDRPRGPLGRPRPDRRALMALAITGYVGGVGIGLWLAWATPLILGFGLVGVGLSLAYDRLRDHGLGPAVAAITYGPLIAGGAHAALGAGLTQALMTGLWSLPVGIMASALFYVNDLADRPLDQAAGHRTLLVRLHQSRHGPGYAILVSLGLVGGIIAIGIGPRLIAAIPVAAFAFFLAQHVARHADDPGRLAPARLGTLALQAALTALLATA